MHNKQENIGLYKKINTRKQQKFLDAWQIFLNTPLETRLQTSCDRNPEDKAIELFQQVAATVPAYQTFLQTAGIDPQAIATWVDFQNS